MIHLSLLGLNTVASICDSLGPDYIVCPTAAGAVGRQQRSYFPKEQGVLDNSCLLQRESQQVNLFQQLFVMEVLYSPDFVQRVLCSHFSLQLIRCGFFFFFLLFCLPKLYLGILAFIKNMWWRFSLCRENIDNLFTLRFSPNYTNGCQENHILPFNLFVIHP